MSFIPTVEYTPSGDYAACDRFIKYALKQLSILERDMEISNTALPDSVYQGVRRRSPAPGVQIECVSWKNHREIKIHVEPPPPPLPTAGKKGVRKRRKIVRKFGDIPLLGVTKTGQAYFLYYASETGENTFQHPFELISEALPWNSKNVVQLRRKNDDVFTTITIGCDFDNNVNGFVWLQRTTSESIHKDVDTETIEETDNPFVEENSTEFEFSVPKNGNSYLDIFSNKIDRQLVHNSVSMIDSLNGVQYSTEQSLFWAQGKNLLANISPDGNTLYIVIGGNIIYTFKYEAPDDDPEAAPSWVPEIEGVTTSVPPEYTSRSVTYIDENGYAYGYSIRGLIPSPDYIGYSCSPSAIEWSGSILTRRQIFPTITRDVQYRILLSRAATGSFGYVEETDQIRNFGPTTKNKSIEPISVSIGDEQEDSDWGETRSHSIIVAPPAPLPLPPYPVDNIVSGCGYWPNDIFYTPGNFASLALGAINTYYTYDCSDEGPDYLLTDSTTTIDVRLDHYKNKKTYNEIDYFNSYCLCTHSSTGHGYTLTTSGGTIHNSSIEYYLVKDNYTSSNISIKWPIVISPRITFIHETATETVVNESTTGVIIDSDPEEITHAKCLAPFIIEDYSSTGGFTCTCTDDAKNIGRPTSTIFGTYYCPDSNPSSGYNWKLELDGKDLTDELFVTKFIPSPTTPWAEETWTPEFDKTKFAYLCYLF